MPHQGINIELLNFSTLLIRDFHPYLLEYKKLLIKYAWLHLKNDDVAASHSAYVSVCNFIRNFDGTPPKIIFQVYNQLLKQHNSEVKGLVREALDVLVPVLTEKLATLAPGSVPGAGVPDANAAPGTIGPNAATALWINCTRRVLMEEANQYITSQMLHVIHVITRHPTWFYPFRAQFLPSMIPILLRILMFQSANLENKRLALAIVDLVITWERKKRTEFPNGSTEEQNSSAAWSPKVQRIDTVAVFLVKLRLANHGRNDIPASVNTQTEDYLKQLLELWPQVTLKLEYLEVC